MIHRFPTRLPGHARMGLASLAVVALFLFASGAHAKPIPPDEDGLAWCIIHDDGEERDLSAGKNRCCYEESVNDHGDTLTICVQCDGNGKNCTESPGTPKLKPNTSTGSISEPRKNKPRTSTTRPSGGQLNKSKTKGKASRMKEKLRKGRKER